MRAKNSMVFSTVWTQFTQVTHVNIGANLGPLDLSVLGNDQKRAGDRMNQSEDGSRLPQHPGCRPSSVWEASFIANCYMIDD